MRFSALFLMLPALAMAQPPAQPMPQIDPQQFYEESKKMMLPMVEETLPAMREARSCLEKAGDQAAFEACGKIMEEVSKKMQARMGGMPGMPGMPPGHQPPQGAGSSVQEREHIEWNDENKQKMLQFLDRSILMGDAMKECMQKSGTMEQMQQCMQSKRPSS